MRNLLDEHIAKRKEEKEHAVVQHRKAAATKASDATSGGVAASNDTDLTSLVSSLKSKMGKLKNKQR